MNYHLDAEYESGYHHIEDDQDHSPYERGRNIFYDILHRLPEKAHGKLVCLSLVGPEYTYSIDWTTLPDNARPIRFKDLEQDFNSDTGPSETRTVAIRFGYQYTNDEGRNVQEITEVK